VDFSPSFAEAELRPGAANQFPPLPLINSILCIIVPVGILSTVRFAGLFPQFLRKGLCPRLFKPTGRNEYRFHHRHKKSKQYLPNGRGHIQSLKTLPGIPTYSRLKSITLSNVLLRRLVAHGNFTKVVPAGAFPLVEYKIFFRIILVISSLARVLASRYPEKLVLYILYAICIPSFAYKLSNKSILSPSFRVTIAFFHGEVTTNLLPTLFSLL